MKTINNVFQECYNIFQKQVFSLDGIPNSYKIQEAFIQKENSAAPCFGCSMRDSLFLITNYLKKQDDASISKDGFVDFFLLQNLLVDRMETMLDILKIDAHFRQKEFKVFQEIRQWTYFFKLNLNEKGFQPEQKNTISTSFLSINIIELTTRFCEAINKFIELLYQFLVKTNTPQYLGTQKKEARISNFLSPN